MVLLCDGSGDVVADDHARGSYPNPRRLR